MRTILPTLFVKHPDGSYSEWDAARVAAYTAWLNRYEGGLMFGEIADLNGQGPCQRCVGHAVSGPITTS